MNAVKCIRIAAACCLLLALLCGVSAAAEGQKFVCKVSSSNSADFPPYRAFDEMVAYLTEKSGGRISVIKYDDSQLGSQVEVLEALQMGVVQMTMPLTADLAGFDQRIQVLDLPFLFSDFESVRKALHGELGKRFDAIFDKQGFKCMGYNPTGIRSITNNKRAIYTLDDLKGMKIRTMQNPMHIAMFKLLGANPTPLSYSELYTALQQGVVDGQENGPIQIVDAGIQEVQKFYSLTKHVQSVTCVIASKKWYDSMPADLQEIFSDALRFYEERITRYTYEYQDECMEIMRKAGVQINDLTTEERAKFKARCEPIYKDFEKVLGKDMIQLALDAAAGK